MDSNNINSPEIRSTQSTIRKYSTETEKTQRILDWVGSRVEERKSSNPDSLSVFGKLETNITTMLIQTSQLISQEIVLSNLLDKLLQFAMDITLASRVVLLLKDDDTETFNIVATRNSPSTTTLKQEPLTKDSPLPLSVIDTVLKTQTRLYIGGGENEFEEDELFQNDPYLKGPNRPKSLLCVPIKQKGSLQGLLYFGISNKRSFLSFIL
jgi:GAF domain-containing protein